MDIDNTPTRTASAAPRSEDWLKLLAHYREPNLLRSLFEIVITAAPFAILWMAMLIALDHGHWIGLLLALPAAGFLVRLFMIQHDCGHYALFRRRAVNDWVGRAIGVLTLTPYDLWRRSHATHHATTGNLDRRGIGDITTLTLTEYRSRSRWRRLQYRLYRHPAVLFALGPAYLFFLQHRLPVGFMRNGWMPWISTMATNAGIVAILSVLIWFFGVKIVLLVHLPIAFLAAAAGVWLFFVQHQFEGARWDSESTWSLPDAALYGSSHYVLPDVLRWFTANIGVHHVHHLCSRIPFYRLPRTLADHPELAGTSRLTLIDSIRAVRLALWDEHRGRLISFRDARVYRVHPGSLAAAGSPIRALRCPARPRKTSARSDRA